MHVNDEEMFDISNSLNKPLNILDELDGFPDKFAPLPESGLYVSAFDIMNKQIISISQSINNLQRIINVQTGAIFESEMFLSSAVESITLPTNEEQIDSSESQSIKNYVVSDTGDGLSVTNGETLGDIKNVEMDTLSISKENLINQNNVNELNKAELDDYASTTQQSLEDISNDNGVNETEFVGNYDSVTKEQLENPNSY